MTVQHVREALGTWDINLDATTPRRILDLLDLDVYGYSHLVITPLHINTNVLTGTGLLDLARYTGVYRKNNLASRREGEPVQIEGVHLAVLLGDEEGKGDNFAVGVDITNRPFRDASNTSYITAVLSRGNGLTTGSVDSAASPSRTGRVNAGDTARQLLDYACSTFSKEWRVNPNGTLDAAAKATIYPTTVTPTVAFLPEDGGRDGAITGIEANVYRLDSDVEDYSSAVTVRATSTNALGSASIGVNPYVGWSGAALTIRRAIDSQLAFSTTSADNVAATQLARFDETRRHVRITTSIYDVENFVGPGDGIFVFDPDQDLYDLTRQVFYRGRIIFPLIMRVEAIRWPVQQGMGVYLRYWTGSTFAFLDLTDWVLWEDRDAELDIGDIYRTLGSPRRRLNV